MTRGIKGRQLRTDAAMLVALVLVVQAFLAGLAGGARADTALSGLNVICGSDGSVRSTAGDPADGLLHGADCCTLGCPMLGGLLPEPIAAPLHPAPGIAPPSAGLRQVAAPVTRTELAPLNSRAPPEA